MLQVASCRYEATVMPFHDDHHHTDAVQAYLGPSELRMELVGANERVEE